MIRVPVSISTTDSKEITEPEVSMILLVEDDPDDFYFIKDLMTDFYDDNYQLYWVDQFDKALDFLSDKRPVVCLVDYQLGEKTGLQLLKKTIENDIDIPIILLTGLGDRDMDQRVMSAGAADYLPKGELTASLLERTIRHAIERADLLQKLKNQARIDMLTGLYNRRYIEERLNELVNSSHRHNFCLSLALCDLDDFKDINDKFGHHAGDVALQYFSGLVGRNVRSEDLVGRYGGDEFLIIFQHDQPEDAAKSIERILNELKTHTIQYSNGLSFSISASFGLASLKSDMDKKELIKNADLALYRAKIAGRGCFEIYEL